MYKTKWPQGNATILAIANTRQNVTIENVNNILHISLYIAMVI